VSYDSWKTRAPEWDGPEEPSYEACKEAAELAHKKTAMLRRVMEAKDPLHPETRRLVQDFADALAEKLIKAQQKYGRKDDWRIDDWEADCRAELMRHIEKGDPLDVAAYCAFMWRRGWSTTPPAVSRQERS
jgi:hypothetical protein